MAKVSFKMMGFPSRPEAKRRGAIIAARKAQRAKEMMCAFARVNNNLKK